MEMHKRDIEPDFNLREWAVKSKMVSRENTLSRRFSAPSFRRSFIEDPNKSFRSNVTISSTASSPGYNTLREEIDPSTYSFTAALKALQARSAYSWECLSPDGFALHSKWNEAEKYICNPLSGEVPLECLSAKTLSARSFRSLAAGRITMSAPLIYPSSRSRLMIHPKTFLPSHENEAHFPIQEEEKVGSKTRDVGTQSTHPELSSSSSSVSPAPTPSIEERSIKRHEADLDDSPISTNLEILLNFGEKVEVKETIQENEPAEDEEELDDMRNKAKQTCTCMCRHSGCLSWRDLWMRKRKRVKQKPRKKNMFLHHINEILNKSAKLATKSRGCQGKELHKC